MRDMTIALVFRVSDLPEGMSAADIADYLAHVIEDRDGTPDAEACAAMHGVTGQVLGHFVVSEVPAGQEPHAGRLAVKGPSSDMKEILGRFIEAGNMVGGAVPVRPAMLKRTTLPVRLLLSLHAAGVSLPWLLSGIGEPLREARLVSVEGRLHVAMLQLEDMESALAKAWRTASMTLDDLIEAKEGVGPRLAELTKELEGLRKQLRGLDEELAASRSAAEAEQARAAKLESELKAMREQVGDLEEKLAAGRADAPPDSARVAELEAALSSARAQVRDAEAELAASRFTM